MTRSESVRSSAAETAAAARQRRAGRFGGVAQDEKGGKSVEGTKKLCGCQPARKEASAGRSGRKEGRGMGLAAAKRATAIKAVCPFQ